MNTAAMANGSTAMHFKLDDEFYARMKHNFKVYVLLSSKSKNWREDVILGGLFKLNGYKSHRAIKYDGITNHILVKFNNEEKAEEALRFLNKLSFDLTAVLVDVMLRDWFNYEVKSGFGPPCTLTIVDIVGHPPLALNFLTSNILNSILKDFGDPHLLPYTAALNEPHVQVMFGSMAEALAACMAFGEWYQRSEKTDLFCYRVRINPSDKEGKLITHSGGEPKEAFRLDYFLNMRKEVPWKSKRIGRHNKQEKMTLPNVSQSRGTRKVRKHVPTNSNTQISSTNQVNYGTQILCLPIIAPVNNISDLSEAFVQTSRQFGTQFANALMNFQKPPSVSTEAAVATNYLEIRSAVQHDSSENVETSDDGNKDLNSLSIEDNFSLHSDKTSNQTALAPAPQNIESFSDRDHNQMRCHPRCHTRVFERRK